MNDDTETPKPTTQTRPVRVPFAGYVTVEVDASIEPKLSRGWSDEITEFEDAALAAAWKLELTIEDLPRGLEWSYEFHKRIVEGNLFNGECNEIEDVGE